MKHSDGNTLCHIKYLECVVNKREEERVTQVFVSGGWHYLLSELGHPAVFTGGETRDKVRLLNSSVGCEATSRLIRLQVVSDGLECSMAFTKDWFLRMGEDANSNILHDIHARE